MGENGLVLPRRLLLGMAAAIPLFLSACREGKVPSTIIDARRRSRDVDISPASFRGMDSFYPVERVAASTGPDLPAAPDRLAFSLELDGERLDFDTALERTHTNALLVIDRGTVVDERYFNGADADSCFISWSMAKSVTSILAGTAVERGEIAGLDDPVDRYAPDLRGTLFGDVLVRHLLTMRDGSSYREMRAIGEADVNRLAEQSLITNRHRFTDFSTLGLEREHAPGAVFNYSTLTTGILGRVVEGATGQRLARLTEERLWRPAGMQRSAYWLLDGDAPEGQAFAGGGFNACLRDYGRIGQMMLDGGVINGRRIVPEDWVTRSTRHDGQEPVIPGTPRGYGYQWWTFLGTRIFEAVGVYGQFISVDPDSATVIVKLSHWPEKGGASYAIANHALFTAIRAELLRRR